MASPTLRLKVLLLWLSFRIFGEDIGEIIGNMKSLQIFEKKNKEKGQYTLKSNWIAITP